MDTGLIQTPVRTPSPGATASVSVHVEPAFDFLSDAFSQLFERASATAFQLPCWLDAFYRRLAPERGAEPAIVTGRRAGSGELVFVLPLIRRRKMGLRLLEAADLGVGDYAAPVVSPAFRPDSATLDAVAAALPAYDILRIRPVRREAIRAWRGLLGVTPRRLDFSAHATALPSTHAAFRAQALDASFARYLARKATRFRKAGGAHRLLNDPSDIRTAIGAIQSLRAGRFAGDPIQSDYVRDFYADAAVAGAASGATRTYALTINGEAIGYTFGLTHAGRFNYLLIGCDYHAHGRHSPGLVLYDAMIADWIEEGGAVFDFTIGDEAFKRDFGAEPTPMFELVHARTLPGRIGLAAFDAREKSRRRKAAAQVKPD